VKLVFISLALLFGLAPVAHSAFICEVLVGLAGSKAKGRLSTGDPIILKLGEGEGAIEATFLGYQDESLGALALIDSTTMAAISPSTPLVFPGGKTRSLRDKLKKVDTLENPIKQEGPYCLAYSVASCLRVLQSRNEISDPDLRHKLSHEPAMLQAELNRIAYPPWYINIPLSLRAILTLTPMSRFQMDRMINFLKKRDVATEETKDLAKLEAHLERGLPAVFNALTREDRENYRLMLSYGDTEISLKRDNLVPTAGEGGGHSVFVQKYLPGMDLYVVTDSSSGFIALWKKSEMQKFLDKDPWMLLGREVRLEGPILLVSPGP
jgi:hypothetical protein